jgi:tetratricopeptide (TPR) repeat protein
MTINNTVARQEALSVYDQAIRLDPNYAKAYNNKGNTLTNLKRPEEAQQGYQKARELGYNG